RAHDRAATADVPLTELKGVGAARAARLARLGIRSVRDLLTLLPAQLLVWPEAQSIATAAKRKGERVTVEGRVVRSVLQRIGGRRSIVRATLADGSGEIGLVFFNQPWMKEQLGQGRALVAHGEVTDVRGPVIAGPKLGSEERPLPAPGTLEPVYVAGEGVTSEALGAWIQEALDRFPDELAEPLPPEFLERTSAPDLDAAACDIHRPASVAAYERARRRFALEPILKLQASVFQRRRARSGGARAARVSDARFREVLGRFPFELTEAQQRVTAELRSDLARTRPMRRLLQGDVGAGKTAVAAAAAMVACEAGGQVAFMAPTEVLASQHAYGLRSVLENAGLRTALLTGALPTG
ncbi:MAG: DEAD/DEAH box helicase, partial [Planctomycetota bacterium]